MASLTRASRELFRRTPDESFETLEVLHERCVQQREQSLDRWHPPTALRLDGTDAGLRITAGSDGAFALNDWSFTQLCGLAGVSRDTLNRLTPGTAGLVLRETLPADNKPLQLLMEGDRIRSIHGTQYSRLWNADLVDLLREQAIGFEPPHKGFNGASGLYAGEQDMFCFLIDPAGWVEIGQETFAPGFFV